MIIVFEGLDRSGKSTARRVLHQMSLFRGIVRDRDTISDRVYARFYGRKVDEKDWNMYENMCIITMGLVIVFVDTPPEICFDRVDQAWGLQDLRTHRNMFLKELVDIQNKGADVLVIDGTFGSFDIGYQALKGVRRIEVRRAKDGI